jgi:hypothetical protein
MARRDAPPRIAAALAAWLALGGTGVAEDDPWRAVEALRAALAADGPLEADFSQSFVPAGFTAGDTEAGAVALSLPDCLRWDYTEPDRKSFLVCGARAWSWVEGEPRGQRFTIEADRETGLDLLLLPASDLAARYRAITHRLAGGELEIVLEPLARDGALVVANLTLGRDGRRIESLDWRDREGSVTSFRFARWRSLVDGDRFAPPLAIEWVDPGDAEGVR